MSETNNKSIQNICVFCGSKLGSEPNFAIQADKLAETFIANDIGLVYGGGTIGLMGVISKGVHLRGGKVTGVIPRALRRVEISGESIGEVIETEDMHARKRIMAERSDAFIAMPGGFGTYEELFEVITWQQLGIHRKPIGCYNINGYFNALQNLIQTAVDSGFIDSLYANLVIIEEDPVVLVQKIQNHVIPSPVLDWYKKHEDEEIVKP